jgi:hypothetical protein
MMTLDPATTFAHESGSKPDVAVEAGSIATPHQGQPRLAVSARQAWLAASLGSCDMVGCTHCCCREPRMHTRGLCHQQRQIHLVTVTMKPPDAVTHS